MGLHRHTIPDQPACPFRCCGEVAHVWSEDLWRLDELGQPAAILSCAGHAERLAQFLRRERTRPTPMQYRMSEVLPPQWGEWTRLPEGLYFAQEARPRMLEFRRSLITATAAPLENPEQLGAEHG